MESLMEVFRQQQARGMCGREMELCVNSFLKSYQVTAYFVHLILLAVKLSSHLLNP